MRVDGREITVSGSLLQPLTRRTNDILRLVLCGGVTGARDHQFADHPQRVGCARKVHLRDRRGLDANPVQPGVPGVRRRDSGAAVRDPDRLDHLAAVEAARRVRGRRVHRVSRAVDHRQRHRRAEMALRPVRSARHAVVAVPRRPAVDRDARRRAHRFRAPGCPRAGGGGGGRCCLPSCRSTSSSARSYPPARCWVLRSVGSSARWWFWSVGTPALEVPLDGAVRALARRGFVVSADRGAPAGAGPLELSARVRRPDFDGHRRDVRPESTQRWIPAPVLALAAAAQQRNRSAAGLHAPGR